MDPQLAITLLWISTGLFFVCQAFVAIWLLADNGIIRGILALVFFPYTYYWGWREWDSKLRMLVMTIWSLAFAAMAYLQLKHNIL